MLTAPFFLRSQVLAFRVYGFKKSMEEPLTPTEAPFYRKINPPRGNRPSTHLTPAFEEAELGSTPAAAGKSWRLADDEDMPIVSVKIPFLGLPTSIW